ncbi:MAG: PTPA-CTERM sorting domain-containing protein [Nodosilinea sp.]
MVISPDGDNQEPSLMQFGGIWDIYLYENLVQFDLNSRFRNVTSGQDVYRFQSPSFEGSSRRSIATPRGDLAFAKDPEIIWLADNWFEVIFPLGFAPVDTPNLTEIPGRLGLQIDLIVDPTPVPSPVLLPGLISMALAALRQRRSDHSQASLDDDAASGERAI